MLYLASCYERGVNIPMDKHKAFEIFNIWHWLNLLIRMNSIIEIKRIMNWGVVIQNGIGIEQKHR